MSNPTINKAEDGTVGFYGTAKKIWKAVVDKDGTANLEALQQELEIHKKLLSIFQPGDYYYFLFNIYNGELEIISEGMKKVLGYTPGQMDTAFLIDKIHPDDKPYFLNFEYRITQFFLQLPFDKISKYKVQYDYRVRDVNNKYIRILQQAVQIDYDEQNFYRTLVVHTDISHIKQEGAPCFSIIGLEGEPSYYNIKDAEVFVKSYDLFTKREREVLKHIVEGKSTKEIAAALFLSPHTINAHRKNILHKANCKTPLDLLSKAIHEGWV